VHGLAKAAKAFAVPTIRLAVTSEWQRDWARADTLEAMTATVLAHGGGSAIAFAWEQQLLRAAAAR
jgi:hypothetical protein